MESRYDPRQAIFRTKCKYKGKVCKVIVDSGSLDNIVSIEMVEKLNVPRIPHESSYKAFGLSDD